MKRRYINILRLIGICVFACAFSTGTSYANTASQTTDEACNLTPSYVVRDGLALFEINQPCAAYQTIVVIYEKILLERKIDQQGQVTFELPLFKKQNHIEIQSAETETVNLTISRSDLKKFTQVALVWDQAVNLDLHIFEPSASNNSIGHIFSQNQNLNGNSAKGSLLLADTDTTQGSKIEYYRVPVEHFDKARYLDLKIENLSLGGTPQAPYCGEGTLAELKAYIYVLNKGRFKRHMMKIAAKPCGIALSEEEKLLNTGIEVRVKR